MGGGDVGAELDEVLLELQGRAAVALVRLEHARRVAGEELTRERFEATVEAERAAGELAGALRVLRVVAGAVGVKVPEVAR